MALTKVTPEILEETIKQVGFKNKIIGGDFSSNPWQRGTTFTAVANATYTADRWRTNYVTGAVTTITKTQDAPSLEESGVYSRHCLHVDVTTSDAALSATEIYHLTHIVEGYNIAYVGFGQPGTRFITLSFWHKHTKTGTYCVSFTNESRLRSYVAEYVQNTADTWEKAIITIPVDTTGLWQHENREGLAIRFVVAAGSSFQTSANNWNDGEFFTTSNQVNALDSNANNFKIALVQLEVGDTASTFEQRAVNEELQLCQRYYEKSYNQGVNPGTATYTGAFRAYAPGGIGSVVINIPYKVTKRTIPTVTVYSPVTGSSGVFRDESGAERTASVDINGTSNSVIGNAVAVNNTIHSAQWTSSAEY